MRYYKVVLRHEYKGGCVRIGSTYPFAYVMYTPGKWAVPRNDSGPLAVFNSLKSARSFVHQFGLPNAPVEVWRCDIRKSRLRNLHTGKFFMTHINKCPPGTVLASKVKLLWRVEKSK